MCFGIVKANVSMRQIKVVDGLIGEWAKLVFGIEFAFAEFHGACFETPCKITV